jgi:L-malate glycosyltransferase
MKQYNKQHNKTATILFAHFGGEWIRGSERCLLDLLSHLDKGRFKAIVWCNSETMANELRRMDIDVVQSDFPRLFKLQYYRTPVSKYYGVVRKAIELIDQHDIKLIHANSSIPTQFLNFVARARNIPLISHLHSRNSMSDRVSNGLHQVSMAVGVSQPVIDQLMQDGMPREHTCVIANGIDTDAFMRQPTVNFRKTLKLSATDFVIATTGSLIRRKGIDIIIDAMPSLRQLGIPVKLMIIGEGPEMQNLQQQSKRLGVAESVMFLGERNDVSGLLRGGVNLYVSAPREEAFGLALAEASLAELAVIAPDTGGIKQVIIDGKTGRLFPAGDASILRDEIVNLYRCAQLRNQMGKAGRQHIYDNLTIQHNVERFHQLYTTVLNAPSMHLKWHSRWQWRAVFSQAFKYLLDKTRTKFYRMANI